MKVLMLADGASIHSRRALDWHLKQGCEVTFVDWVDPAPKCDGRYRFVRYPGQRGSKYLRKVLGDKCYSWLDERASIEGLRRIFRNERPEIVHLYQIDQRAYHCLKSGLKPLVMSSWGTDINQHFTATADADYRCRTAEALASADLIIADAADIIDKCASLAGRTIPAEVLPLGIDTELFRPGYEDAAKQWRHKLEIPADATVLFSIRALTPLYGHVEILNAFHQALSRFRERAFLVFKAYNSKIGSQYELDLRQLAEQLGVANLLRWETSVPFEQLPALYAAADAIINFPAMDGFPVTFLEAAACQRPVITNRLPSYVGTFAEKYFHMIETRDVSALANEMVKTVNDSRQPGDARRFEARAIVETSFSEIVTTERLMSFYRNLIACECRAGCLPGMTSRISATANH